MSGFRWFYVPLIFLIPWAAVPAGLYFGSIKKIDEQSTAALSARNTARQAYSGPTTYDGLWPPQGGAEGQQDKDAQEEAYEATMTANEETLEETEQQLVATKAEYEALWRRYHRDINANEFDYDKPREFIYHLLELQRDQEGPRFLRFIHRTYPDLYFSFDSLLPPPPLTPMMPPATDPTYGRLPWPVGKGAYSFTVYGPYEALLSFVETFPERYDRIAQIGNFSLTRIGFDHTGSVLMQMDITIALFTFPRNAGSLTNAPAAGAVGAVGAPGAPGAPGMAAGPGISAAPGSAPIGPPGAGSSGPPVAGPGGSSAGAGPMPAGPMAPPPSGG